LLKHQSSERQSAGEIEKIYRAYGFPEWPLRVAAFIRSCDPKSPFGPCRFGSGSRGSRKRHPAVVRSTGLVIGLPLISA
jgi:hypothetical protein